MQADQQARDDGGKTEFDDHHPVQGRGRQDHDGAQRSLDEAQADDRQPAETLARVAAGLRLDGGLTHDRTSYPRTGRDGGSEPSATAAAIMPVT